MAPTLALRSRTSRVLALLAVLRVLLSLGPVRAALHKLLSSLPTALAPRLPNLSERELWPSSARLLAVQQRPKYGTGMGAAELNKIRRERLGFGRDPLHWKGLLLHGRSAREMLGEVRDALTLHVAREEMTMNQVVEGVRRVLLIKNPWLPLQTDRFWSEAQCTHIAHTLLRDCGVTCKAGEFGFEPEPLLEPAPFPTAVSDVIALAYMAGRRAWNACGLRSRWVRGGGGDLMHCFDSGEHATNAVPLVIVHGMFTTSQSLAHLALLLRPTHRVLVPDLPDFDNGFSHSANHHASDHTHFAAVARLCLGLGLRKVDLLGHSYGGHVSIQVAKHFPWLVRRLLLLCPAGTNANYVFRGSKLPAMRGRYLRATINKSKPYFNALGKHTALPFMMSPNALNILCGCQLGDYLDGSRMGTVKHETLLVWGTRDKLLPARGEAHVVMRGFEDCVGVWVLKGEHWLNLDSVLTVCGLIRQFETARDTVGQRTARGAEAEFVESLPWRERLLARAFSWTTKEVRVMGNHKPGDRPDGQQRDREASRL